MKTSVVMMGKWAAKVSALLLASGVCLSAQGASDADLRLVAEPITAKALDDSSKTEPEDSTPIVDAGKPADVVELPVLEKPAPKPVVKTDPTPAVKIDTDLDAELLKLRRSQKSKAATVNPPAPSAIEKLAEKSEKKGPKPLENTVVTVPPDTRLMMPAKPMEPGYASVLTGTLTANTEVSAEALPHLVRGMLIVPAKMTLKINAGATIHLRSDANAPKPLQPGAPDPSKGAAIWVYGTLLIAGDNGHPVEVVGQDKDNTNIFLYGAETSKIEGARFKGTDVAQNGGVSQWINCEFNDSKYFALASGAGNFTHCTFKKCGGIFAAYEEGPWALMVRRCLFDNCRDGLLLNRDPGQACLLVERNNFVATRGANLRAMPRPSTTNSKTAEELLIGENWYGTTVEEEIDRRIVDRRTDPTIKVHLNTRLPSEKPYANTGAGATQTSIANTINDQQTAWAKMLTALATKQKTLAEKSKAALEKQPLEKALVNSKEVVKKEAKSY